MTILNHIGKNRRAIRAKSFSIKYTYESFRYAELDGKQFTDSLSSLEGIERLTKLTDLCIEGMPEDYEQPDILLYLNQDVRNKIRNLKFKIILDKGDELLRGFRNLESLELNDCLIKDYSILRDPSFNSKLKSLSIAYGTYPSDVLGKTELDQLMGRSEVIPSPGCSDISFLDECKSLTELVLDRLEELKDLSAVYSEDMKNRLVRLGIRESLIAPDISQIAEFGKLEGLDLYGSNNMTELDILKNARFKPTLRELNLSRTNICNISIFKDYSSLQILDLDHTRIQNLFDFLEYESVRNKSLKKIDLSGFKNWNGWSDELQMSNRQVVNQLIQKGIEVITDKSFRDLRKGSLATKIDEFINEYGDKYPIIEKFSSLIKEQADLLETYGGGYGSEIVINMGRYVFKISAKDKIENETRTYSCMKGTQVEATAPRMVHSDYHERYGFIMLENINPGTVGKFDFMTYVKKSENGFRDKMIKYNIHQMALFHKEMTAEAGLKGVEYGTDQSFNSNQNPEFRIIDDYPHTNATNLIKEYFLQGNRIADLKSWAEGVVQYIKQNAKTVIHGDWKPENTYFDKLFDYSDVRQGVELEDLMRFLTNPWIDCTLEEAQHYANEYVRYRCEDLKDVHFRDSEWKNQINDKKNVARFYEFEGALYFLRSAKRDLRIPDLMKERGYSWNAVERSWGKDMVKVF